MLDFIDYRKFYLMIIDYRYYRFESIFEYWLRALIFFHFWQSFWMTLYTQTKKISIKTYDTKRYHMKFVHSKEKSSTCNDCNQSCVTKGKDKLKCHEAIKSWWGTIFMSQVSKRIYSNAENERSRVKMHRFGSNCVNSIQNPFFVLYLVQLSHFAEMYGGPGSGGVYQNSIQYSVNQYSKGEMFICKYQVVANQTTPLPWAACSTWTVNSWRCC